MITVLCAAALVAALAWPPARTAILAACITAAGWWLGFLDWLSPVQPGLDEAVARHPSRPRVYPGLPADGEPLTGAEERALGRIEMDALIIIAEPTYGPRKETR